MLESSVIQKNVGKLSMKTPVTVGRRIMYSNLVVNLDIHVLIFSLRNAHLERVDLETIRREWPVTRLLRSLRRLSTLDMRLACVT